MPPLIPIQLQIYTLCTPHNDTMSSPRCPAISARTVTVLYRQVTNAPNQFSNKQCCYSRQTSLTWRALARAFAFARKPLYELTLVTYETCTPLNFRAKYVERYLRLYTCFIVSAQHMRVKLLCLSGRIKLADQRCDLAPQHTPLREERLYQHQVHEI